MEGQLHPRRQPAVRGGYDRYLLFRGRPLDNQTCPTCGARWFAGQHDWSTGKPGNELDLNALVCRRLEGDKAEACINPCKGQPGGVGWEEREKIIEQGLDGL